MSKKVAIILGSESDLPVVKEAMVFLKNFGLAIEVHVMSAHQSPEQAYQFSANAKDNGIGVIIAAVGKATHLTGVLAANTTIPIIGIPCKSSSLDGLNSILSAVQMPKGIPIATVAAAENAGIYAAQILGVYDEAIALKLKKMKSDMAEEVVKNEEKLLNELLWENNNDYLLNE